MKTAFKIYNTSLHLKFMVSLSKFALTSKYFFSVKSHWKKYHTTFSGNTQLHVFEMVSKGIA